MLVLWQGEFQQLKTHPYVLVVYVLTVVAEHIYFVNEVLQVVAKMNTSHSQLRPTQCIERRPISILQTDHCLKL